MREKHTMGLFKLTFWGLLVGGGLIAGLYLGTGEVPSADSGTLFDDPSRAEVDGEYIQWIELRESGVFVKTKGVRNRNVYVTLPNGETHEMFRPREYVFEKSAIYPYEQPGLPSGNYTVKVESFNEIHESHTVYLEAVDEPS